MSGYNNINNNNNNELKHGFQDEKFLLRVLLKQLGRREDDMSWEELIHENIDCANNFTTYVNFRKYHNLPLIASKYKKTMCRSVAQRIPCKYGLRCNFAHSKEELESNSHDNMPTGNLTFESALETHFAKEDNDNSAKHVLRSTAKEFIPCSGILTLPNLSYILNVMDKEDKEEKEPERKDDDIEIILNIIKNNTVDEKPDNKEENLKLEECEEIELEEEELEEECDDEEEEEELEEECDDEEEEEEECDDEEELDDVNEIVDKIANIEIVDNDVEMNIIAEKLEEVVLSSVVEDDGTCRAMVATTKVRCTAPSKNCTLFCGRHKNYKGELMV